MNFVDWITVLKNIQKSILQKSQKKKVNTVLAKKLKTTIQYNIWFSHLVNTTVVYVMVELEMQRIYMGFLFLK